MNVLTAILGLIDAILGHTRDNLLVTELTKLKMMVRALQAAEDINTATIDQQYREIQDLKISEKKHLDEIERLNKLVSQYAKEATDGGVF